MFEVGQRVSVKANIRLDGGKPFMVTGIGIVKSVGQGRLGQALRVGLPDGRCILCMASEAEAVT